MDWELWIRMALAGASIVQIPAVIGRSREHPEQKTTGEELYLYQLRSILLEHDDALRGLEGYATELPAGEPITTMPHRPAEATSAGGASHWEVRSAGDPGRIALAVHQLLLQITIQARSNRARLKTVAARVLGRSRIERLRFHIERLKEIARARHYNFAGVRLVDAVSYARMKRAAEMLHDYEAETRARRYALSEEKRRFESQSNKITDRITALLLTILGVPRNPKIQDRVDALYKNGLDVVEIARTLAVDNFEFQQNPQFARSRHLLVQRNDWPLAARGVEVIGPISIVDIGAEPLAYESHIYEPLRSRWPTRVLGFDPFSTADETTAAETKSNGVVTELTILPHFIGSGHEATFHINRSAPTSSLFASNLELAKRFSLLDQSLETVATRQVGTRTLDAALAGRFGFEQSVDFLKIDVQGGTLDILTAAPEVLARTLVCQVEVEFAELYKGEGLFGAVHEIMADHSFGLLDFADLGRQRYAVMDQSRTYFLNAGRLLWADSIYVRHLDDLGQHRPESLLKIAIIMHEVYLKYDVAAEALHFYDNKTGSKLAVAYASAIV
jgi:FkbM family methyltransferase